MRQRLAVPIWQLIALLGDYPPAEPGLYVVRPPGDFPPRKVRVFTDILIDYFGFDKARFYL